MIVSLYDHPDRYEAEQGAHDEDLAFYARAVGRGQRVVEVGGGTGRLAALAQGAARWWALERSPAMVAAWTARAGRTGRAERSEVVEVDVRSWRPPVPIDVWILPFNVVNHLPSRTLPGLWRQLAAASAPGARLALDAYVWTPAVAGLAGEEPAGGGVQRTEVDARARRVVTTTRWPDGLHTEVAWTLPTARALRAGLEAAGWRCGVAGDPDGAVRAASDPKVWITAQHAPT
jgi:hypothetical protein